MLTAVPAVSQNKLVSAPVAALVLVTSCVVALERVVLIFVDGIVMTFTHDLSQHIVHKETVCCSYIQQKIENVSAKQSLVQAVTHT